MEIGLLQNLFFSDFQTIIGIIMRDKYARFVSHIIPMIVATGFAYFGAPETRINREIQGKQ